MATIENDKTDKAVKEAVKAVAEAKPDKDGAKPAMPEARPAAAPARPAPDAKPEAKPEDPKPEEKPSLLDDHIKRPEGDLVLTVKVKRLFFFGVVGQEVKVMQGDKVVDRITTDSRGQALFKLPQGEYTVTSLDKQVPIELKSHATLRL